MSGLIFVDGSATTAPGRTLDTIKAVIAAGADGVTLSVHPGSNGRLIVEPDVDLADVIEAAQGRLRLDLQLAGSGHERALLTMLADHGLSAADVIVTSPDARAVARIIEIDADVLTGWRTESGTAADIIDGYFSCGADVLAPRHDLLNADFVREAEREEVAMLPWTVDDAGSMRWLLRSETVLGVVTSRVAEAVRVRAELRK